MFLQNIKLANFKNYKEAEFSFSSKINCFIGNNGAGKTNVLDAIYYLSFCKSYFNPIDSQNILHESPFFTIHGNYQKNKNGGDLVSCIQKRNHKKQFKLNNKEYDRLSDHIGLYPLVMISPYDRDLINEGSDVRRKYIDTVISQFDKIYLDDLINYNKALLQRNILLKKFAERNYFDKMSIEIWDVQLIKLGEKIHSRRKEFLIDFLPLFQHYFSFITNGKEKVDIKYASQLNDRPFEELLSASIEKDRITRFTNVGTHKDDLLMSIEGHPIKRFGSQGQQKSYVIAIKLAQFEYTRNIKGFKPILLLDDIFDKLDKSRVKQIIYLISDNSFGQAFITDTQKERINEVFKQVKIDHKIFEIIDGKASELDNTL
ncbi:MAG: DNA replication and repair protein RecF [Bacteroidetes bacterium 4484_249]|nr:MAG: DNA replication and repair protein RecF [Bacteroidetes bacterium 4484_249]